MGKYKFKFEIQGLKLEVEGDRAEAPQMTDEIQRHLAQLVGAPLAASLNNIHPQERDVTPAAAEPSVDVLASPVRQTKRRAARPRGATANGSELVVEFVHDPLKWGDPIQSWTTQQKAIWLLFVIENQVGKKDLPGIAIANTFNKFFRHAKRIQHGNVNRDLRKVPQLTGEDPTTSPSSWFLTHQGKTMAGTLVAQALATSASNGTDGLFQGQEGFTPTSSRPS